MSQEPREFWIKEVYTAPFESHLEVFTSNPTAAIHVIEKSYADQLKAELASVNDQLDWSLKNEQQYKDALAELKAENWVLRDQGLRTYDGLATKADACDAWRSECEKLEAALVGVISYIPTNLEQVLNDHAEFKKGMK